MRSGRLLSALLLLQSRGRMSTREIAEHLEISERTAHRDMEALCEAGVPLVAHRGMLGGWELERGWRTRVPGLDEAELNALLMAQPSGLGSPHLAAAAQRAYDKLTASLPRNMRAQAESMRLRLHVDPTGWRPSDEDIGMLPIVQDAVTRDVKLTFAYTRPSGESYTRTVEPFGLVCKQATWYLVARTPDGMRTYRVSRMREAVALAISFKRPARFRLAAYWQQTTARLRDDHKPIRTTLALAPEAVRTLTPWCPLHPTETSATIPPGWVTVEAEFESLGQARFVVLGLASTARALAPATLVQAVAAELRALTNA